MKGVTGGGDEINDRSWMGGDEGSRDLDESLRANQVVPVTLTERKSGQCTGRLAIGRWRGAVKNVLWSSGQIGDEVTLAEHAASYVRGVGAWLLAVPIVLQQEAKDASSRVEPFVVAEDLKGVDLRVREPREIR